MDESVYWTMVSSLATVAGVIVTALVSAFTFWKTYSRMRESEQVKMAHDIGNNLSLAEEGIIKSIKSRNLDDIKLRYIQYLNVWEWYSFLVNKNKITIQEIIDHYKSTTLKDRNDLFSRYPEFRDDEKFKEYRELCEKLENEKD